MYINKTMIQSENTGRYLQTLCRHFARKVPAKWMKKWAKLILQWVIVTLTLMTQVMRFH